LTSVQPAPQQGISARQANRYGVTQRDFDVLCSTIPYLQTAVATRELERRDFGFGTRRQTGRVVGTLAGYANLKHLEMARGRFLSEADLKGRAKTCVLAPQIALDLFGYQDPIGASIHVGSDYYTVVGVLK